MTARSAAFTELPCVTAQSRIDFSNTVFKAGLHYCGVRIIIALSVRPPMRVTSLEPLDGFSRNSILENFTKTFVTFSILLNVEQQ